jgi:hypothetical protein
MGAAVLEDFRPLFESAQEAMARGEFSKIVPVLFENGRSANGSRS